MTEFSRVTQPGFVAGLAELDTDALRSRRDECLALENSASYVRRFVQGRLDLVAAASQGTSVTSADDVSAVLADSERSAKPHSGNPRPPASGEFIPGPLMDQLDAIVSTSELRQLSDATPDRIQQIMGELATFEQQVSADRRKLHEVIDAFQAEIVARYQSGAIQI